MKRFLLSWLLLTVCATCGAHALGRIDGRPPARAAQHWAIASLDATRDGSAPPAAPAEANDYRAAGPVIALAWERGRLRMKHVGDTSLVATVRAAAERFATLHVDEGSRLRFSVSVPLGEAPLLRGLPYFSSLLVVPLREGVVGEIDGERVWLTPDELWASGAYDKATDTPIPDLSFGANLPGIEAQLARELGVERERFLADGSVRRFAASSFHADAYPGATHLDIATLERAAREGALFLLRHQANDGRYAYIYDGRTDRAVPTNQYNLPRHAGSTHFLAQAARVLGLRDARRGALRALSWVRRKTLRQCGEHKCVAHDNARKADVGSSALAVVAAAEVLRSGDNAGARLLVNELTAFLRSMQRPDGELMHDYDLIRNRPIDVQHMYYSGEAALALWRAHRVLGDERNAEAAKRLMGHLTGRAWSFFGSRYFYGEEHWTCQAVAESADRMDPSQGLAVCLRWLEFQRKIQYGPAQTWWASEGAYGVGPWLLPRTTPAGSRTEAGAPIYQLARQRSVDTGALRGQLESAVRMLLRVRWAPGPAHLFFNPERALGGVPESQVSLHVRNDFIQHAGNAMLAWTEVLRGEHDRSAPSR